MSQPPHTGQWTGHLPAAAPPPRRDPLVLVLAAAITIAVILAGAAVWAVAIRDDGGSDDPAPVAAAEQAPTADTESSDTAASDRPTTAPDTMDTDSPQAIGFRRFLEPMSPELYQGSKAAQAHLHLRAGWSSCEARRDGTTIEQAALDLAGSYSYPQAKAIVAAAGISLCPELEPE